MTERVNNLRIHLYGVQGSGSVFPSRAERRALQAVVEVRLLEQVFADLARYADTAGRLDCTLEDIVGGELGPRTLRAYRERFRIEEARVYGGWTTCVRIETADDVDIVLDLGSGFRNCAHDLQRKWGEAASRELHVFGSHSHYDHTEGFDQAAVCFDPRNAIVIHGNRQFLRAIDQGLGIFSRTVDSGQLGLQTPLNYQLMPARFRSCEIRDLDREPPDPGEPDPLAHDYHHLHEPVRLGQTTVQPFEVFHPAPCLGYRVERGGNVFVFVTDHELRHGDDPDDPRQKASMAAEERVRDRARGADVMYRDGQFFRAEYDGHLGIGDTAAVPRIDWGHSCVEDVMQMAEECAVRATYIGHHDPNRIGSERHWIDESLERRSAQTGLRFALARAETVIDL